MKDQYVSGKTKRFRTIITITAIVTINWKIRKRLILVNKNVFAYSYNLVLYTNRLIASDSEERKSLTYIYFN